VTAGEFDALTSPPTTPAIVADTNVSVLSSMSATRGASFARTRREKSGGMARTPFSLPLRRSASACPWSL
jgi:hypothetical protein